VETAYQQAFLHGIGCDELQGYYFSKPLPMKVLEMFILENNNPVPDKAAR
jgi:EAL domain-containing protein (putative c-di-GMP-specific phosphodiesterase class I)